MTTFAINSAGSTQTINDNLTLIQNSFKRDLEIQSFTSVTYGTTSYTGLRGTIYTCKICDGAYQNTGGIRFVEAQFMRDFTAQSSMSNNTYETAIYLEAPRTGTNLWFDSVCVNSTYKYTMGNGNNITFRVGSDGRLGMNYHSSESTTTNYQFRSIFCYPVAI